MSRPIRILELRSVRGTGGGPEKTILLGAAQTDRSRFAVTVCYLRDRRDDVFGIDSRAAGLPVDYVEIHERHSFDLQAWTALRGIVRERRIDIVHAHEYKTDLLAWMLHLTTGVFPLATVHGWTGHTPRERRFYYPLDKRLLAWFPRLVAVSSDIAGELVRHGARPERVTTILNGIDDRVFRRDPGRVADARARLGLAADTTVVGAVGRLEPQKRFDLLLDAFAAIRPTRPDLQLVIVGDGSLAEPLKRQADALGLGASCRLTGHSEDIVGVHHAFDLFVQSSDYEGTPNAVLEAMALETPLIATDVGGTRELFAENTEGILIAPGSADILREALSRALDERSLWPARARAARQRIERELSFTIRMRKLERIYEEIMGAGTPGRPALAGSYS